MRLARERRRNNGRSAELVGVAPPIPEQQDRLRPVVTEIATKGLRRPDALRGSPPPSDRTSGLPEFLRTDALRLNFADRCLQSHVTVVENESNNLRRLPIDGFGCYPLDFAWSMLGMLDALVNKEWLWGNARANRRSHRTFWRRQRRLCKKPSGGWRGLDRQTAHERIGRPPRRTPAPGGPLFIAPSDSDRLAAEWQAPSKRTARHCPPAHARP